MHRLPTTTRPAGFDKFPFTSTEGQAFVHVASDDRVDAGHLTFAVRSSAFREWFFGESFAQFETVPSAPAWTAIRHHLEAQAARYERSRNIPVPRRVDARGPAYTPDKILLDLSNLDGQFVEISPEGWKLTAAREPPFPPSRSTRELPAPDAAPGA